ncbi:hypothetical protein MLD38_005095 [Melastoma candidum]|uniref:Uncharacterized protein n=1 Tax=Melastoma candidum TaxID=119954 RepID=A0ACB9S7S9_9MYRT|nr:hypothetical protein MLD38_005095 [Melastoma candidum]
MRNCGFTLTNENMTVFRKNSGLLLVLFPLTLLGNTLYPPCLRAAIWGLGKLSKRPVFMYILKHHEAIGYEQLLPGSHSSFLLATAFGFLLLQFVLLTAMEWGSQVMAELNTYQRIVAAWFQVVNTRHSGETTFELASVSTAVLVLFIVMMYLLPYTTFLPTNKAGGISPPTKPKGKSSLTDYLLLSPLSYLAFFVILVCVTEREKLRNDPLNFNVLNITIEVISAYGNVGYSMGYSCISRLEPTGPCKDTGYGFVGRWSTGGKIALIVVMFFGRLKKFFIPGGKAWKLS